MADQQQESTWNQHYSRELSSSDKCVWAELRTHQNRKRTSGSSLDANSASSNPTEIRLMRWNVFFVILESFELRIAQHKSVTTTASNIPWNRWYEEMYHYFFGVKKILKFFLRIVFQFMVPNNPKSISKRSLSSFFWERKEWRFCLMQSWCRTGSKEFSVEFIQSKNEKFEMAETCTNRSLDLDSSQKNTKRSEIFVRTN